MERQQFKMQRSKVFSPYYPENGYVNPNFPFGLSRSVSQKLLNQSKEFNNSNKETFKKSNAERKLLKKLKREALPFSNIILTV